ncbi:MAG: hypothetical protein EA418_12180 [Wenzhouxiangellaceae bacterium]|nr:MAG: hypothetical protein EA418_12180 [Wenzhouxiangellaceae bacterium]
MMRFQGVCLASLLLCSVVLGGQVEYWQAVQLPGHGQQASITGIGENRFPDGERGLWIGTSQGSFRRIAGRWRSWPEIDGKNPTVTAMQVAPDETGQTAWWLGTPDGLYSSRDGENWTHISRSDVPLADDRVTHLHLDQAGGAEPELWIGTALGLSLWRAGQWTPVTSRPDGFRAGQVLAIRRFAVNRARQRWVATTDGLSRLVDGQWQRVAADCLRGRQIKAMETTDIDGRLHVAVATSQGLYLIDAQAPDACFQQPVPGTERAAVLALVRDTSERLYVFTENGVERWHRSPAGIAGWAVFDQLDGLDEKPAWNGITFRDSEGLIWAGTDRGIWQLRPGQAPTASPGAVTLLINGEAREPGTHSIPWVQRSIEVELVSAGRPRSHAVRARLARQGTDTEDPWRRLPWKSQLEAGRGGLQLDLEVMDEWGRPHGPVSYEVRHSLPWLPIALSALIALMIIVVVIMIRQR